MYLATFGFAGFPLADLEFPNPKLGAARHYYWPQRSCGQGNIFTSVCQEFCPQGGGLPQCMMGYHHYHPLPRPDSPRPDSPRPDTPQTRHTPPPGTRHPPPTRHPPQNRHPPDQTSPGTRPPPQDTVNERLVRILLECILVLAIFCQKMLDIQKNWTKRDVRAFLAPLSLPMVSAF